MPDGAAVDAEGGYWCALRGGWCLHRYRPDGRLDRTVRLPVSQPTMSAFAGRDLDLLIVTTATDKLSADRRARAACGTPAVPADRDPRHPAPLHGWLS